MSSNDAFTFDGIQCPLTKIIHELVRQKLEIQQLVPIEPPPTELPPLIEPTNGSTTNRAVSNGATTY